MAEGTWLMTRRRNFLAGAVAMVGANGVATGAGSPARGFTGAAWTRQQALEAKLRAVPEPARIASYMKRMAAEPRSAGGSGKSEVEGAESAVGVLLSALSSGL